MVQRSFVFAVLAFGLAACGGGELPEGMWAEDAAAQRAGVGGSDSRTGPDPACEDARDRVRACRQRLERSCEPIEERLRTCRARLANAGATARDRRACLPIARELNACLGGCDDLRAQAEDACAEPPDACESAREALSTCMAGRECRGGALRMRACMERAQAVCDRVGLRSSGAQPPAFCQDPEDHCRKRVRRRSDCFATCEPLIDDVRAACTRPGPGDRIRDRLDRRPGSGRDGGTQDPGADRRRDRLDRFPGSGGDGGTFTGAGGAGGTSDPGTGRGSHDRPPRRGGGSR